MPKSLLDFPKDSADFFINLARDKRFQKAPGPVLVHYYLSLDKLDGAYQMKQIALSCHTYRMKTSIDPIAEKFIDKAPVILKEIKDDFLQDNPVIYLYTVYQMPSIDSFEMKLAVRYAVPDKNIIVETKEGVDNIIKKEGINYLLNNFGNALKSTPGIGEYIKESYPEYRDKVRLWNVLHGVEK